MKLDDKTSISLGLGSLIIGGMAWLFNVQGQAKAAVESVDDIKSDMKDFKRDVQTSRQREDELLMEIRERVIRIETLQRRFK